MAGWKPTATEAERRAFAAGARKVEEERDMRAMERIATALERIAKCMEKKASDG